jgi:group I intron endonuclease
MNKVYHGFSHSSGVYKITNKDNGLVYFGQAVQLATRAMQHEKALVKNKHDNRHLQFAWNHYGSDAFEFEVIAVYPERTERDAAEQALIDEHYGPGCYNIMKKVRPERTTYSHTPEETRAKQSAAMKGKKHSPEHRAAIGAAHIGKKRSPETCAAMSAARKGKKHSPEHRAAVIAANKAKKLSPEYRAAMSAALKGQTAWNKGKKLSPEHLAAMKAGWAKRRAAKALSINESVL